MPSSITTMKNTQSGFTVVELLVTILVTAIFITIFFQSYNTLIQVNADTRTNAQARDLAYTNLRRYPTIASTGKTCSVSSQNLSNTVNVTVHNYPQLGKVSEEVKIDFPYSCTTGDGIAKITSIVKYKNNSITVSHVTYVN